MRFHSAALFETDYTPPSLCGFGISAAVLGPTLGGFLGAELGIGATAGGILAGGLEGAAIGAGLSGLTGGDPLTGALTGGLTGGAIGGFGAPVGEALGVGATGGNALVGATAGTVGSALTGGDPLTGALTGGAGGLLSGAFGGSGSTTPTTSVAEGSSLGAGGGTSAVSSTAGVSPSGGTPVDLTASNAFGMSGSGEWLARPAASPGSVSLKDTGGLYSVGDGAAAGKSSGDFGSKIMGIVENNPGAVLGAGILGVNMLMGDKPLPGEAELKQSAGEAASKGRTLAAYQESGTLPSGLQSVVDQQFESAKAAVVDQYGKLGLGNSTMMQDKLNQLKTQKSIQIAQFADMLAKQGIEWTKMSNDQFNKLLAVEVAKEEAFGKALGSFATGLAGLRTPNASA